MMISTSIKITILYELANGIRRKGGTDLIGRNVHYGSVEGGVSTEGFRRLNPVG